MDMDPQQTSEVKVGKKCMLYDRFIERERERELERAMNDLGLTHSKILIFWATRGPIF
jgi:hypothetical protein